MVGWVHFTLPGVFGSNPEPYVINGQLWTLQPEFECYVLMAVVMAMGLIARRDILLAIMSAALVVACGLYFYDRRND